MTHGSIHSESKKTQSRKAIIRMLGKWDRNNGKGKEGDDRMDINGKCLFAELRDKRRVSIYMEIEPQIDSQFLLNCREIE